MSKEAACKI